MTKSNNSFFIKLYKYIYNRDLKKEYEKETFASYFEYILKAKIDFDHTSKIDRKKLYEFLDGLDYKIKNQLIKIAKEYGKKMKALHLLSENLYSHYEHSHDDLSNFVDNYYWNKIQKVFE